MLQGLRAVRNATGTVSLGQAQVSDHVVLAVVVPGVFEVFRVEAAPGILVLLRGSFQDQSVQVAPQLPPLSPPARRVDGKPVHPGALVVSLW